MATSPDTAERDAVRRYPYGAAMRLAVAELDVDHGTQLPECCGMRQPGNALVVSRGFLRGLSAAVAVSAANAAMLISPWGQIAGADSGVFTTGRLGGADRIQTAIAISQNSFPTAGSAAAVVLTRSEGFADGVAGTPLAISVGGPMLLTERPDSTRPPRPRSNASCRPEAPSTCSAAPPP